MRTIICLWIIFPSVPYKYLKKRTDPVLTGPSCLAELHRPEKSRETQVFVLFHNLSHARSVPSPTGRGLGCKDKGTDLFNIERLKRSQPATVHTADCI